MNKFESIINLIIAVLQCLVPRIWKKKKPDTNPAPTPKAAPIPLVEAPCSDTAPLPSPLGNPPKPTGSSPSLHRSDTITRSVGICLMVMGGVGSLYRLLVE